MLSLAVAPQAAIADGTHVPLRENNLLGSRHIRYGGYGGIAYHHIADSYIALFTTFIARKSSRTRCMPTRTARAKPSSASAAFWASR